MPKQGWMIFYLMIAGAVVAVGSILGGWLNKLSEKIGFKDKK